MNDELNLEIDKLENDLKELRDSFKKLNRFQQSMHEINRRLCSFLIAIQLEATSVEVEIRKPIKTLNSKPKEQAQAQVQSRPSVCSDASKADRHHTRKIQPGLSERKEKTIEETPVVKPKQSKPTILKLMAIMADRIQATSKSHVDARSLYPLAKLLYDHPEGVDLMRLYSECKLTRRTILHYLMIFLKAGLLEKHSKKGIIYKLNRSQLQP